MQDPVRALPTVIQARKHVALLQSDASEAALLADWLALAGHECTRHSCGDALLRAMRHEAFDIVIADWNVRNVGGKTLIEHIRANLQSQVPVIFISALDQEAAIVAAFRQGADDYMVKPVRRMELLARLDAISRRSRWGKFAQSQVVAEGGLRFDREGRNAWRDGRSIVLTAKDFDLAVLFLSNVGRLLSRAQIQTEVWGIAATLASRTLDTHMSRLRARLGLTPQHGWQLVAVYGQGYRLDQVKVHPVARPEDQSRPASPSA